MSLEALFAAIAEAVFGHLLQQSGLAERARALLGLDPARRAFQTALAGAYAAFARQYPEWTASLFDETFLKSQEAVPLLADLLTRRGRPDPAELARRFAAHLGHRDPDRWERLSEAIRAAADFLTWLEAELARQEALQPLYDSRALERIAENTEAIRQQLAEILERIGRGQETPEDIRILRRAVQAGQVILATGERAVALGGRADGAIIVTGDGNIVQVLSARQRADLERLLAARRYNIPPLPEHYVPREEYLAPLRRALLGDGAAALGIVGVRGMGGIGKSVLAAALAHDLQVQAAFPDGVVWLPIGREPNLPARQEELYLFLTGQRENFRDEIQGRGFLASALADKACLVILDDVWDARHAEAFPLRASPSARYLLTTRNAEVLQTLNAQVFSLDVLTPEQALALLADWAGQPVDSLPAEAREVARECGYLPLALAMVGAFVRQNPESWERALHRLQSADLEKLRCLFPGYEHPTLLAALEVSVEALPQAARARYLDLAVFPEEAVIPLPVLQAFWGPLGLDEDDVADLAETFVNRSLARRDEDGRLRLHDLQHDYLRARTGNSLPDLHRRFLQNCARSLLGLSGEMLEGLPWHRLPPQTPYLWDHLAHHHLQAGARDALYTLLTDFDFLEARCRATSVFDLEADYHLALAAWPPQDAERRRVLAAFEERLRLEAHRIAQAPEWLFPALYNHLRWPDAPDGPMHRLCEAAATRRTNYLRSRLDPRPVLPLYPRSLGGHIDKVNAVAVSPDGRFIVSGSDDRTVKVWDLQSSYLLRSLEGHTDWVRAVGVSPDGRIIVSGSDDRTVKMWDLESGRLLRSLEGHSNWVWAAAVSPDGQTVVSGSADHTVKVWDLETGRLLRSLEEHTGGVNAVAVSPDGRFIVSGSWDHTVKVWEAESGRLLRSLEGHAGAVRAVAVSPDSQTIVSGSNDGMVKIWDMKTGCQLNSLEGHANGVWAVAVSADGRFIISGSADCTVKVWEAKTGHLVHSLDLHTGTIRAVAVSPDNRFIVSGSADHTVKVWEVETGHLVRSLEGRTTAEENSVTVSPDRHTVISSAGDRIGKEHEEKAGRPLRSMEGHTLPVQALAVSPDGQFVVSGAKDCTVKVWEAESGRLLHSLEGHSDGVEAVAVSPNSHLIVSGAWDNTIIIWESESGRPLRSLKGHTNPVTALAISLDGRFIISGSDDRTVKIWEAESGHLLHSLEGHTDGVWAVAISPDGHFIVSGSDDRIVRLWEMGSGRLLCSLEGHTDWVTTVTVTPDGQQAVSGSRDCTLKVWDLQMECLLHSLEEHTGWVWAVTVSPDGRFIVSGADDHTVRAWNLESGTSHVLFWNDAAILSLALSGDGRLLACGDAAGRVWIFDWVQQVAQD